MPRGRPRDQDAHRRILDAAYELIGTAGREHVSINDIADAAEVSKQTIYRWWPSRTAVILDALVASSMRDTPFPETDDVRLDFRAHLRSVIEVFSGETGRLIATMLAEGQSDRDSAGQFRERFWQPRRDVSLARLRRGVELGQIRSDIDAELVLDAIYGPIWLRLLVGHLALTPDDAEAIVDAVWNGIAVESA